MKTKNQKSQELANHLDRITRNRTLLFADLSGVSANGLNSLRARLREFDSEFKVSKKRLLRLAFAEKKINLNPEDFSGQLGVVFSPQPVIDLAGPLFKFAKTQENFKILGGYDLTAGEILSSEYLHRLASLPSREVLLGQFVGMLAAPLKLFMLTLRERSKTL